MTRAAGLLTSVKLFALTAIVCLGVQAISADGLATVRSNYGPKETMNRLEAEVKAKGMTVFARVDHAAGAAAVGLALRPTESARRDGQSLSRSLQEEPGRVPARS